MDDAPATPAVDAPPTTKAPKKRRGRAARRLGLAVGAAVALPLAAVVAFFMLLRDPSGTAWLLGRTPGVQVTAPRGALLGTQFGAERMRITWPGSPVTVDIEGLEWRGAQWRAWGVPGVRASLRAESLSARRVLVHTGAASAEPPRLPATLRLPIELAFARVDVGELQIDALEPAHAVSASVHLGAAGGTQHRVEALQFDWDRLHAGGQARLGADAPYPIDAALDLRSRSGTPWEAVLRGRGPLEAVDLRGTLRGQAPAGREAPALDVDAQLRPFAAWPLGTVNATTKELDLALLASGAPQTRLAGRLAVTRPGANAPFSAEVELDNDQPGRWDQGRLPLQRARLALRGNPAQSARVDLPSFDLQFADALGAAGRWSGQGVWDGTTATLDTRLTELRPQRLDGRAAAMRLSGPLALALRGLPSPDQRAAPAAPAASQAASAPTAQASRWRDLEADFRAKLDGVLDRSPQPVALTFEGSAAARQWTLRSLRASAGDASAQLSGQAQQRAGERWQLRTDGQLANFDPVPWFPGPEGSAWRRGPHRLSATWKLALSLPERALGTPPLQWLQTLQGDGELDIAQSQLAGVPVQGRLHIGSDPAAPPAQRSHAEGELRLGSNRLTLDGRGDPLGRGDSDRWRLELKAGAAAELAPIVALFPEFAAWSPRQGSVDARLAADGRWPNLRIEGEATLQSLRAGELSLARGHTTWRMDTGPGQAVELQAELAQASFGVQRVESLRASVRGTLAEHRLSLDVAAPVIPPPLLARLLGLRDGPGTQARLVGQGSWAGNPESGGQWRGTIERLTAGVWAGSAAAAADADVSWLDTAGLRAEVRLDAQGRLVAASADAGRAKLAGGLGLRWDEIRWRGDAQRPELAIRAEIDPVAVAPMLQRAQVGVTNNIAWSGDLRVAARVDVRAGDRFDADITLRRQDGDLLLSDGGTPRSLGVTDLELAATAHDGLWRVTPLLVGRSLGALSGTLSLRATPQQRWPGRDAALEGALSVQVPDLAVWAGWVPPGWRLEGALSTAARLGGTFGAPEYSGELRASGVGVRNLLQGVALSDGQIVIALKGDNAQIERFTWRGGDGTLSAEGRASFGAAPQAQLAVKAEHFRVLGRIDRQIVVSGSAALALQPDRLRLDGRLGVDSGLVDFTRGDAPSLDDDVTVRRDGEQGDLKPQPAPVPRLLRNATVAIDVDLGNKLRLRGRGLDTTLAGELKLSTPGGRLAINGTVRAENGTYAAYGQKLEIERGLVGFSGPPDSARLDILALRPNLDTRVGVAITGTALNPRVRLYSEPDMSEADKLSWLVLGRGPDGLGRTDTALLQRAAVALLAGEGEGPTDALMRSIGLDDISLRQTDGEVRETVITLGKQLSRRWYVGYERGVNATTGTWQLIYRIAQRFTLRAQSGLDNSLDLIWTWRFGRP